MITPCYRLAFRQHLLAQRFLRDSRNARLFCTIRYSVGNVGVSEPVDGMFIVWTSTPRQRYLRIVSQWDGLSPAQYSASMLYLRLRREEAIRQTVNVRIAE